MYGALRAAGLTVDFKDLLQLKYMGSTQGSSFQELVAAIQDHGGHAVVLSGLTTDALRTSSDPMILYVRQNDNSRLFDHFVLFLGTDGNRARIVDAPNPLTLVPLEELQLRWSGEAILVSRSEPSATPLLARSRARVLAAPVVGLMILTGAWLALRRLIDPRGSLRLRVSAAVMQLLILLGVAVIAGTVVHAAAPGGFYRNAQGARTIRLVHIGDVLPSLDLEEARRMVQRGAVFVDTRLAATAAERPIDGAQRVSISTPPKDRRALLRPFPANTALILFTEESTDRVVEMVARDLIRDGYENLYVLRRRAGEPLP